MKKHKFFLSVVFCILSAVLLWGCGGGTGSPGSQGCEEVGLSCEAAITPIYLDQDTSDVDVVQDMCDGEKPEDFTAHSAKVAITLSLLNPNTQLPPGTVYIQKYTVEFSPDKDSEKAPPIESYSRKITVTVPPPSGTGKTTVTFTADFITEMQKIQYIKDMLSGEYNSNQFNYYTVTYILEGVARPGDEKIRIIATKNFSIGNYDNCSGGN